MVACVCYHIWTCTTCLPRAVGRHVMGCMVGWLLTIIVLGVLGYLIGDWAVEQGRMHAMAAFG
jgi:hypothetical protein